MPFTEYIQLNDGNKIPLIAFGVGSAVSRRWGNAEALPELLKTALQAGYRHIDTAEEYENEKEVAEGIRMSGVPRKDIFITAKDLSVEGVTTEQALRKSLKNLDVEYVDTQSEDNRAQMANLHLNEMLDIFEKHKQSLITDVEFEIKKKFRGLEVRRSLCLMEFEETPNIDGSVTARKVGFYPFSISSAFWTHLSVFMQQRDAIQQQAPVRKVIYAGYTEVVERMVQDRLAILCRRQSADEAACFLQLERARLCSHARERLRSSETPLTTQQLADVGSLDDDEIVSEVLQLAPETKGKDKNYRRAIAYIQHRLPQPKFEWQTKPLDPNVTPPAMWPNIYAHGQYVRDSVTRSSLNSVTRSIVTNQFVLFLVEVLDLTTADISPTGLPMPAILGKLRSLRELSSFATTVGDKIATALATDLGASFTYQNEKLLEDFGSKADAILEHLVRIFISSTDRAKILIRITGVSPRARKVLATKEHSKVKRFIEEEFHLISSGRYSWLKELKKLRISDEDMAELLLGDYDACPTVFYTEVESDEVQTYKKPLYDYHLNGCAHCLLEAGDTCLDSPSRVAAISNTSSSASFQDIEIITKLHKICGLAGVLPTSRKKEKERRDAWDEVVDFLEEEEEEIAVAHVTFCSGIGEMTILKRIIAALGGLCTAFENAQHLDLCCNSYTVFCIQAVDSPPKIEAFRIEISVAWQLLEVLRSVLATPGKKRQEEALAPLFDKSSPLHSALQPFVDSHSWPLPYSETDSTRTMKRLHVCSLAAQFLSLAFLSYTQAHKGGLFPSFLTKPLRRVVLHGSYGGQTIEMVTRPMACIGDMLDTAVISFRLRWQPEVLFNQKYSPKHNIYANLADIVDTWGPAELLCATSDQGPFAMRIGGGILYTEDPNGIKYHWSEAVDLDTVSRKEMDPVGKLLIGAVHVNSGCQSDYGALRGATRLQTLGTQEQSYRVVLQNFGFSLGQLFSVVVQASVKHSAGVSHKKTDQNMAQHHVMSLLDYRSAVQVSYCTGICQRVRFRDMVADLLREFGPGTVHSDPEAKAWGQLLNTNIEQSLKGDGAVRLKNPKHQELLENKVKEMYGYLFHSGINADRTLRVAWPSREDRHAYSPIPCSGTNAWAKLLSESTHISSYAYIAPHCLQADRGSACQGGWEPATGLSQVRAFATRVQCVNAVKSVAELPHESICFFQLMRIMVFAQVHHPDGEPVILRVILHTVRASVVRRVVAIWHRTGKTITQVQESRYGATRAEEVLVVCGWDA